MHDMTPMNSTYIFVSQDLESASSSKKTYEESERHTLSDKPEQDDQSTHAEDEYPGSTNIDNIFIYQHHASHVY